jgi:hypothetical protein
MRTLLHARSALRQGGYACSCMFVLVQHFVQKATLTPAHVLMQHFIQESRRLCLLLHAAIRQGSDLLGMRPDGRALPFVHSCYY